MTCFLKKLTFTLLILSSSLLRADINEIHSLKDVIPILNAQDSSTLVVFDIDYVLLTPKDKILRFCGVKLRRELFPNINTDKEEEALYNQMLVQGKEEVLEPISVQIIRQLQQRGVPVIALTSRSTNAGNISWLQQRVQALKEVGIDLSGSYAQPTFTLDELTTKGPSPVFNKGILFTNGYSKGEVLKAFIDRLNIKPKQVIFIDDQKSNLLSAEKELEGSHITFSGFQDLFVEDLAETCSIDIAKYQVDYLNKTGKWLSDEQAQELLNKSLK